jgi:hypothetical protein
VRTFEDWAPGQVGAPPAPPAGPEGPTFHLEPRRKAAARSRAQPVLGGTA